MDNDTASETDEGGRGEMRNEAGGGQSGGPFAPKVAHPGNPFAPGIISSGMIAPPEPEKKKWKWGKKKEETPAPVANVAPTAQTPVQPVVNPVGTQAIAPAQAVPANMAGQQVTPTQVAGQQPVQQQIVQPRSVVNAAPVVQQPVVNAVSPAQMVQSQPVQPTVAINPNTGQPVIGMVSTSTAKRKTPKRPKAPMGPAKKKKLIIMISSIAGVVAVGAIAIMILVLALRVNYGETYRAARELKAEVSRLYTNGDCDYAVSSVGSEYVSEQRYDEYVESCRSAVAGIDEGTEKLAATAGVRRNKEIKAQFETYRAALSEAFSDREELDRKLDLYAAWHKYTVMAEGLSVDEATEEEVRAVANILVESGDEALKTYGEGWYEKTWAYVKATQDYYAAEYNDGNKEALRLTMNKLRAERQSYVSENKPDILEVVPLSFAGVANMYEEFTKMYKTISTMYEENYERGSGDCTEFLGEVICS